MKMKKKIIKIIVIAASIFSQSQFIAKASDQVSFITGVGTSHFEAHRMAYNSANASGMKVTQQTSRKSADGLWHVIIKVKSK